MGSYSPLPVAILAGGLATRLGEVTKRIPKSLLSIQGKPFLTHQLDLLRKNGIEQVVLCLGHLGEMVQDHFGDGRGFDLSIRYSLDGEMPLGTGGALRNALPLLGPAFFVLYGDSWLPTDMRKIQTAFEKSALPALMTIHANHGRWDRSNVRFEQRRILVYDKRHPTHDMQHIDYGLSVLTPAVLKALAPGSRFDLADLFSDLARKGSLGGVEVQERFYEIGSPQGLAEFRKFAATQKTRVTPPSPDL